MLHSNVDWEEARKLFGSVYKWWFVKLYLPGIREITLEADNDWFLHSQTFFELADRLLTDQERKDLRLSEKRAEQRDAPKPPMVALPEGTTTPAAG